jgi:hypothetical protein
MHVFMPIVLGVFNTFGDCTAKRNEGEGNLLLQSKSLLCSGISPTADRVPVDETAAPAEVIPSNMLELVGGGVGWMALATIGTRMAHYDGETMKQSGKLRSLKHTHYLIFTKTIYA